MAEVTKNIFHYFQKFARDCRGNLFLADIHRAYGAGDAFQEAINLANRFFAAGIREGSLVALRSTRSLDACLLLLALEFLGATAVLTDPHQTVDDFLRDTGIPIQVDAVITNERAEGSTSSNGNWGLQVR